jgi:hypothetical protein
VGVIVGVTEAVGVIEDDIVIDGVILGVTSGVLGIAIICKFVSKSSKLPIFTSVREIILEFLVNKHSNILLNTCGDVFSFTLM